MAMTVIDPGRVADEMLPVAELAVQMRLADGVAASPDQADRLRLRLRAAIDAVERRIGKVLIAREMVLVGNVEDGRRTRLPVAPVEALLAATVRRGEADLTLGPGAVEIDAHRPVAVLPASVRGTEIVRLTVRAGFGSWSAVPDALRQAVLLTAEALDAGEEPGLVGTVEALLAPFREIRLGRSC